VELTERRKVPTAGLHQPIGPRDTPQQRERQRHRVHPHGLGPVVGHVGGRHPLSLRRGHIDVVAPGAIANDAPATETLDRGGIESGTRALQDHLGIEGAQQYSFSSCSGIPGGLSFGQTKDPALEFDVGPPSTGYRHTHRTSDLESWKNPTNDCTGCRQESMFIPGGQEQPQLPGRRDGPIGSPSERKVLHHAIDT